MSQTFKRMGTRGSTPASPKAVLKYQQGTESIKPVDHHQAWRDYAAYRWRISQRIAGRALHLVGAHEKLQARFLRNPYAQAVQRGAVRKHVPRRRIDPTNPYRPLEEWPETAREDEVVTAFHEKYEYPQVPIDWWETKTKKNLRPTAAYYPVPPEKTWMELGLEHPHEPIPQFAPLTYCILRRDVDGLGAKGDVVAVDEKQFRYDLHPQRVAVVATRENCTLLNVPYDPLYQDHERRTQQGKLMAREPWAWDQLQGIPWDVFTGEVEREESAIESRDAPWDGQVPRAVMSSERIAIRKAESEAAKAARKAEEEKQKMRAQGAAKPIFTLDSSES